MHAPITTQQIAEALKTARVKVQDNKRWFTALSKAATELHASPWCWYSNISTLKIASRTTPGTWYIVDNNGCQCPAARKQNPCWHAAAKRLLERASEAATVAPAAPVRNSQQECDELFN
jgi:hypothetical protein